MVCIRHEWVEFSFVVGEELNKRGVVTLKTCRLCGKSEISGHVELRGVYECINCGKFTAFVKPRFEGNVKCPGCGEPTVFVRHQ